MRLAWGAVLWGLVSAILQASSAEAGVYWSSAAQACVPAAAVLQGNRHIDNADGTVGLQASSTLPVVLVCPVSAKKNAPLPDTLGLTYKDSSGAAASARVKATLVRVNRATGAAAQLALVSSDQSTSTATAFVRSNVFTDSLNLATSYYEVRLELARSLSAQDVRGIGVVLESSCGNSHITAPEQCDDGNTTSGDGCSSTCTTETPAVCGNGFLEQGEQCDDGNTSNGDGCSDSCTNETPVCGNGSLEQGEQCDGADLGGSSCQSLGFSSGVLGCNSGCSFDTTGCVAAVCGNGSVEPGEQCDDGNQANGDGCSDSCQTEQCILPADCPGTDTACQQHTCLSSVCGVQNVPAGTAPTGQTAGDCRSIQCDGAGGLSTVNDDADVPFSANICMRASCSQGNVQFDPAPSGTVCSVGGGSCDGLGNCITPP